MSHAITKSTSRNGRPMLLSKRFEAFAAASLASSFTADLLEQNLQSFGPTIRSKLRSFAEARRYLAPLKSFPTRAAVFGYRQWSIVVSNSPNDDGFSDAFYLSESGRCKAMTVCFQEMCRAFSIHNAGETIRSVLSAEDGDRWCFQSEGRLQECENPDEYTVSPVSQRLSVRAVRTYFKCFTGLEIPQWTNEPFHELVGLERSTTGFRVPLVAFETVDDFASA